NRLFLHKTCISLPIYAEYPHIYSELYTCNFYFPPPNRNARQQKGILAIFLIASIPFALTFSKTTNT
ncbi:hypothetical protein, partial [Bacteroides sp. UBA939]|uniref:hypothetical protein n=1 Tax=Bacteroides sp. UBA939 TaxID=1946092 RepID=UPI0025B88C3D